MKDEWKMEYRKMMQQEHFTKTQKEHLAEKLMQSAADGKSNVKNSAVQLNHKILRGMKGTAAACLAGIVLLTGVTGASAAGLLKSVPEVFEKVFKLTESEKELADEIGSAQVSTVVSNGIRVTADAVLADPYAYAVVFSIEKKDGNPLGAGKALAPDLWDFHSHETKGAEYTWGETYSYDEDQQDASIQYVMLFSSAQENQPVKSISVHLSDLYHLDQEGNKDYTINGDWHLNLSFPESSNKTITSGGGQLIKLEETEFTIDKISISPLSYHLAFSIAKDSGTDLKAAAKLLENCIMELELKDGETIALGDCGNGVIADGNRFQFVFGDLFQPLVHLEDIKAIHIGKQEIPVS